MNKWNLPPWSEKVGIALYVVVGLLLITCPLWFPLAFTGSVLCSVLGFGVVGGVVCSPCIASWIYYKKVYIPKQMRQKILDEELAAKNRTKFEELSHNFKTLMNNQIVAISRKSKELRKKDEYVRQTTIGLASVPPPVL